MVIDTSLYEVHEITNGFLVKTRNGVVYCENIKEVSDLIITKAATEKLGLRSPEQLELFPEISTERSSK